MNEDFYNRPNLLLDQIIDDDEIIMKEEEWSQEAIYELDPELPEKEQHQKNIETGIRIKNHYQWAKNEPTRN